MRARLVRPPMEDAVNRRPENRIAPGDDELGGLSPTPDCHRCTKMHTASELPDSPTLRHLKDHAKDLHKAGAAASITDAQFKISGLYGSASWPKLKVHIDSLEEIAQLKQAIDTNDIDRVRRVFCPRPTFHVPWCFVTIHHDRARGKRRASLIASIGSPRIIRWLRRNCSLLTCAFRCTLCRERRACEPPRRRQRDRGDEIISPRRFRHSDWAADRRISPCHPDRSPASCS